MMPGLLFVKKEIRESRYLFPTGPVRVHPGKKLPNPRLGNTHSEVEAQIRTTQCYGLIIYYHPVMCQHNNTFIIKFYKRGRGDSGFFKQRCVVKKSPERDSFRGIRITDSTAEHAGATTEPAPGYLRLFWRR